ncbi:MAG: hypothetical protein GF353_06730 [Candidatus Lokiarchaeota archaeon]|nr:hypothetical protein [Candidatus Lokiarchaeota archaeon]
MYDIIVIGAGISGASFAYKVSKHAKTLLLELREKDRLPQNTNIFPEHNKRFLSDIDYSDEVLFPCPFRIINYKDKKYDGLIDSTEFGKYFGHISYTEKVILRLLENAENNGTTLQFGERVNQVQRNNDCVEIRTNKGNDYKARLLAIGTGSHSFELQKSLGFEAPDQYKGVYTHLYGSEDQITSNLKFDYMFHINPNISHTGPFFINKGRERISLGFLGKIQDSDEEIISKLYRILQNYKVIQPYIKNLKEGSKKPVVGMISKHPISHYSDDRVLVLGEAAGIVTAFFYEGILGGLACADLANRTVKPLLDSESSLKSNELKVYDDEVNRILIETYFKTGKASEYLFYEAGSKIKTLWQVYCNFIKENKTIRRYIWEAIRMHDLEHYDTSRDRWTGEQIFKRLPFLSKATYWPLFLKAMLK